MNILDFRELSVRQQNALLVAMQVRNRMEGFHVQNLSDAQMKELNPLIRYAIYDCFELLETMNGDPVKEDFFAYLIEQIPDYWEVPGRDPKPAKMAP